MINNAQFEQDKEILTRGNILGDGEILEADSENTPIFTYHAQNPIQTLKRIADLVESRG